MKNCRWKGSPIRGKSFSKEYGKDKIFEK